MPRTLDRHGCRDGWDPIPVSPRISGVHMEKEKQAWLRTMGKVVRLIFLIPPPPSIKPAKKQLDKTMTLFGARQPPLGARATVVLRGRGQWVTPDGKWEQEWSPYSGPWAGLEELKRG